MKCNFQRLLSLHFLTVRVLFVRARPLSLFTSHCRAAVVLVLSRAGVAIPIEKALFLPLSHSNSSVRRMRSSAFVLHVAIAQR